MGYSAHAQTIDTRPFFPLPQIGLGTRLGEVVFVKVVITGARQCVFKITCMYTSMHAMVPPYEKASSYAVVLHYTVLNVCKACFRSIEASVNSFIMIAMFPCRSLS